MDMELDLGTEMLQGQQMKVSPRLVAASYILGLSSMELQQAINQELEENPALELIEKTICQNCGSPLEGHLCPQCGTTDRDGTQPDSFESPVDDYVPGSSLATYADDEFDPLTQVAAQRTMSEYLLAELQAMLPREDMPVAEYLVGNLDDSGYLRVSVEEAAQSLAVSAERVEIVLRHLQTLEPVGVGARDLKECLLIQLEYLEQQGVRRPYAREVIEDHLKELGEHRFGRIASALGISADEVAEVWDFIKQYLNPYPVKDNSAPLAGQMPATARVLPDVIITEKDGECEVEVIESKRYFLRVSPMYQQLAGTLERDSGRFNDDERRHIQQYISRAKLFMANINQRRQTLHRITSCLVDEQREFLTSGIRHLRSVTRAMIAQKLGMHESTVSRATAGKYVMLPNGHVIAFSDFFTPSLSVKDVIKEIVEREANPMTDQEIAERLEQQGIRIARRTVAKYREQLRILPSSLR